MMKATFNKSLVWLVSLPLDLIGQEIRIREIGSHMLLKVKNDMIMKILSQILRCHVSHVGGSKVLLEHKNTPINPELDHFI